jgi:hypothetical protein
MENVSFLLLAVLMALTLVTVLAGLGVMVKGGAVNQKYGNLLMRWRVGLQAASLAGFVLYVFSR